MRSAESLKRKLDVLAKRLPEPDVRITCYWGDEERPVPAEGTKVIVTKWGLAYLDDSEVEA
jgi:hypothetical protein